MLILFNITNVENIQLPVKRFSAFALRAGARHELAPKKDDGFRTLRPGNYGAPEMRVPKIPQARHNNGTTMLPEIQDI